MRRLNLLFKLPNIKKGFTLLEMLLVLVIASAVFVMLINYSTQRTQQLRLDKGTLQVQQVLNAALAYYVNKSQWPPTSGTSSQITSTHILVTEGYLPAPSSGATTLNNPWGRPLQVGWAYGAAPGKQAQFYVASIAETTGTHTLANNVSTNALIIAGRLPLGFVTNSTKWAITQAGTDVPAPNDGSFCSSSEQCTYAVGSVVVPGQNLNNARSVNFASVYNSGGCVPAPTCPSGYIAQILVVPASVSGTNDGSSGTNLYSINSFTAYAVGSLTSGTRPGTPPLKNCVNQSASAPCYSTGTTAITSGSYWRVCLGVTTAKGLVAPTTTSDGVLMGSVMAITRCTPANTAGTASVEPAGSSFGVWAP